MSPSSGAPGRPFGSLYEHGFVRLAAAVPHVQIARPEVNAERTLGLARRASDQHAALVVFPELGLSGYSIEDLFHQQEIDVVTAPRGLVQPAEPPRLVLRGPDRRIARPDPLDELAALGGHC